MRQEYIRAVRRREKVDLSDKETGKLRNDAGPAYYNCSDDLEQGASKKMRRLLEGHNKRFSCFEDFAHEALRSGTASQFGAERYLYVNENTGSVIVFMEGGTQLLGTAEY